MNDLFTTCWCGYEAVNARDLTQHQLYCDPHNTAPKVIDDQRKRIAELEAQLAEARAEVESYQAKLAEEQERNLNNVANAQLQIEEITADRDVWREACFRARESGVRALMEIERLDDAR